MDTSGALNTPFYRAFLNASRGVASNGPDLGNTPGASAGNTPQGVETKIALYDAETDRVISGYSDIKAGSVIDLAKLPSRKLAIVVIPRKGAESVKMNLNGKTVTQSTAPYAYYGDNGSHVYAGNLGVGAYTMAVTSYTKDNAKGMAFGARSVGFKFVDTAHAPTPTPRADTDAGPLDRHFARRRHQGRGHSFSLVDARTGAVIANYGHITASTTVKLSSLPTRYLALVANADDDTKSVKLTSKAGTRVENSVPYALFGDNHGSFVSWKAVAGTYDLTAAAYAKKNALGHAGGTLGLSLKFV